MNCTTGPIYRAPTLGDKSRSSMQHVSIFDGFFRVIIASVWQFIARHVGAQFIAPVVQFIAWFIAQ
jgi:hypothetical protein